MSVDHRLRTRATELFGVDYPIVQTGMGWVAGPSLVTGTAEAGGLGILASATMTLDEMGAAIAKVRSRTERPFGVNLRPDAADLDDRARLLVDTGVRVASFAGPPPAISRKSCAASPLIPHRSCWSACPPATTPPCGAPAAAGPWC